MRLCSAWEAASGVEPGMGIVVVVVVVVGVVVGMEEVGSLTLRLDGWMGIKLYYYYYRFACELFLFYFLPVLYMYASGKFVAFRETHAHRV